MEMKCVKLEGFPWWKRRWWCRTRVVSQERIVSGVADVRNSAGEPIDDPVEVVTYSVMHEFYVPLWAWPLELAHRAIFGRVKLTAIESDFSEVTL